MFVWKEVVCKNEGYVWSDVDVGCLNVISKKFLLFDFFILLENDLYFNSRG